MKRLLLVGGGHANIEILRQFRVHPIPDLELLLVSPSRYAAYTGMVPGYLAGRYALPELQFDLEGLVRGAGGIFRDEMVEQVDGTTGVARINGRDVAFDACALDVGSVLAGSEATGVREHAIQLRPLSMARQLLLRFDSLAAVNGDRTECVIVGGGAGGVEVALALASRSRGRVQIALVHEGAELLPSASPRARRLAARACRRRNVTVYTGARVTAVTRDRVSLDGGSTIPSQLTVWLTGAAPAPILASSRVPRTSEGYLSVDDTLRAVDGTPVWGAGDCITLRRHPWVAKAGVYAVREAPVLAHNLRVFLEGRGEPATYAPQRAYLSLLSTGDNRAILTYRGIAVEARWAQALKRSIDRRFMDRYRQP